MTLCKGCTFNVAKTVLFAQRSPKVSVQRCLALLPIASHKRPYCSGSSEQKSTAAGAAAVTTSGTKTSASVAPSKHSNGTEDVEAFIRRQFDSGYRERFIPVTQRTLLRYVLEDATLLEQSDRAHFDRFVSSLDLVVTNDSANETNQLKALFDPINPDKETLAGRLLSRKERLDSEFWLLQRLGHLLNKANFHELPSSLVDKVLSSKHSHQASDDSQKPVAHRNSATTFGFTQRSRNDVKVNSSSYGVLCYWALGKETVTPKLTLWEKLNQLARRLAGRAHTGGGPSTYFKRVVVATRLHRDDKLALKAFKEIPVRDLEQLLPEGKVTLSRKSRTLRNAALGSAGLGLLATLVARLAHYEVNWTLALSALSGVFWFSVAKSHEGKRNAYLGELNKTLYYKNIANNRGLLALVCDRAQDEAFKEALLTYMFLLRASPSYDTSPEEMLDEISLESAIEHWVERRTGQSVEFDSRPSLALLERCGLLRRVEGALSVPTLEGATHVLPGRGATAPDFSEDPDLLEGYDRTVYEEKEQEYRQRDKKRRSLGWF